jgi:hypothetical protein
MNLMWDVSGDSLQRSLQCDRPGFGVKAIPLEVLWRQCLHNLGHLTASHIDSGEFLFFTDEEKLASASSKLS